MLYPFFRELACFAKFGHKWNVYRAVGPRGLYVLRRCRRCDRCVSHVKPAAR